ncbi:hypothetical protein A3I51_05955 [Candidatus Gottesmanbacteria bacterium RIFCSPLOWO2_02_FULL_38_8]|uniref:HMA domain-containing protein n=1 Tax=Candidatus Gottesmanbacteria bacterium RIFCSPLOWO2_02_FULL_38_8 TaxID=1798397 RepID=A0A1F6B276_9BACT|nr:MAG: hypothetical protein A3I51_05955 [Candidatus Gottesmanbacteria bacterium RIFCSPLOWO2_02_FULL_38_8]
MKKDIFQILDMHCTACAMNIDFELEDVEGIRQAKTNYAKAQTEVEYDPKVINEEKIISLIKKAGYTSTPLTIN